MVYPPLPVSEQIKERLDKAGVRYFANDNISEYIEDDELPLLIAELTDKYEQFLDSLIIDRENDPNSQETAKRIAKMFVNEIMKGRYYPAPNVTAFPNTEEGSFKGMLVNRAEILSICSHHHQPVKGVCYIGLLPRHKVIGLSKYTRIAQHCARRGTLQEQLAQDIKKQIITATGTEDVAVYIEAEHGCMINRGVGAHSSLTQTTSLSGQFFNPSVKDEFFRKVAMQQQHKGLH